MAYFSNSGEGSVLEELCCRCAHFNGCNVYFLQHEWNYRQHGEGDAEKTRKLVLDLFVPQKDGKTECTMFIERAAQSGESA